MPDRPASRTARSRSDSPRPRAALALALALLAVGCAAPRTTDAPPDAESIGSLRNARVAVAMPAGARPPLVYLAGERDDDELAALQAAAPNVRIVAGVDRATAPGLAVAAEIQGVDAHLCSPELLRAAPNLRWIQALSAGVDRYVGMEGLAERPEIVLTNLRAVHGPAIAEHAFAMLLSLTRSLRAWDARQVEGRWDRATPERAPIALSGRTMLVVGLGGIGGEIARRAHGFDMHVVATRRSDAPAPDFVARVGRAEDLAELLPEADVVAICVPLTDETRGLFDAAMLARMKRGAILVNVARGPIVDTDALLAALERGDLAGACLDVTDPEPLPDGHPLWSRRDVVITPHVSAFGEITGTRAMAVMVENMRRFGAGEPLLNVVDRAAGY